uniref:Uncharacterized protein n=1 Tax=Octopus bimaculoides TaxID=37653 RepID=A0A0L8FTZ0_OCTBM
MFQHLMTFLFLYLLISLFMLHCNTVSYLKQRYQVAYLFCCVHPFLAPPNVCVGN